jgi:hypothetical protein
VNDAVLGTDEARGRRSSSYVVLLSTFDERERAVRQKLDSLKRELR